MDVSEKFKASLRKWQGYWQSHIICEYGDHIIRPIGDHMREFSGIANVFVNTFLIQEIDNLSDGPNSLNDLLSLIESPIEESLLLALILSARENTVEIVRIKGKEPNNKYSSSIQYIKGYGLHNSLLIEPQKQLGDYRVDFLLTYSGIKRWEIDEKDKNNRIPLMMENKIVVECDGHDFHERTKEQAKKDKSRDRILQSFGYKVYRFTGSEIFQDNMICAEEVIKDITGSSFKTDVE